MVDDTTPQVTIPADSADTINYLKDIQNKPIDTVIREAVEPPAETNPVEEKAKDIKPEEPKTPEAPKAPEFDPAKLEENITSKVSQKVSEEVTKKIIESLQTKTPEKQEVALNEWQKKIKDIQEKEGRNPTYTEALEFVKEQAKAEMKAEQTKIEEEQKRRADEQTKLQEQATKQINDKLDEELNELYASNKLPKIKDANDPTDKGVIARRALFQTMMDVNQKRLEEGKPMIDSVHRIFNNYYKPPKQPAGADAPVSGGTRVSGPAEEDIKYTEIHNKRFTDLLFGR